MRKDVRTACFLFLFFEGKGKDLIVGKKDRGTDRKIRIQLERWWSRKEELFKSP